MKPTYKLFKSYFNSFFPHTKSLESSMWFPLENISIKTSLISSAQELYMASGYIMGQGSSIPWSVQGVCSFKQYIGKTQFLPTNTAH